jgi:hypothetical protein
MVRRKKYTAVEKVGQNRPQHVDRMGDVLFKGFQCLNSVCTNMIFVPVHDVFGEFDITCPSCGFRFGKEEDSKFFDYRLLDTRSKEVLKTGEFAVPHDAYIAEAQEYKYCLLCNAMKPAHLFDVHRSRRSKRQGECNLCKGFYNAIKNPTRLTEQHREAANKRRLYVEIGGSAKLDAKMVLQRFQSKCFKCGKDIADISEGNIDHTLPVVYLWPATTENSTLLCKKHNGEKSGKWPSEYYSDRELRKLALKTGIPLETLKEKPHYNPEALEWLRNGDNVDSLFVKFANYMEELIRLRNRILRATDFDLFSASGNISGAWIERANREHEAERRRRKR